MINPFHRATYLTGPTAVGKTAVSVGLAKRLNAEIIALDSMTLYCGMDIGTAKPSIEEREGVPHHVIDVVDPWESASVAEYRAWAGHAIEQIEARGHRVLFVGGTALYLKTLLRGLFEGPAADPEIRARLENEANMFGDATIHDRLASIDPQTAQRLHPNDRRRVIRALEVHAITGRPLSEHQVEHAQHAPASVGVFAIDRPRPDLHLRINQRVQQMFAGGLVDEVKRLAESPQPLHDTPAQAVGYRECLEHLAGRLGRDEAIEQTQARTRQFAKRQSTWFRGLAEVKSVPIAGGESVDSVVARLETLIANGQRGG